MSELGWSPPAPEQALPAPDEADNVSYNPSIDRLRSMAQHAATETEFGAPSFVSKYRSRAADRTSNTIDDRFGAADYQYLERVLEIAHSRQMICIDRKLGRDESCSFVCRYYVPREYARNALGLATLFEPAAPGSEPDFLTVQIPDTDDVAIRVVPETGMTAVLGTDYTGEAKKSFLRLFMLEAKRRGGLGLHAGSKRVTVADTAGEHRTVGQLFLGLSATGKSTLTAHDLDLEPPASASMVQDDVCALLPDGTVRGSEGNGLYVKTHGLDPDAEPALYEAVTHESAVLENVDVDSSGRVDFDSDCHTTNGRAAIRRKHLSSADTNIDLSSVGQLFFITRNPLMPPVIKLGPDEAAAAFMCGESIETSAGDPSRAGESVRVVGTNPFIIGDPGAEGNRFRELIQQLDIDCFVLKTGTIGNGAKDIEVADTVTIVRELARGTVSWREDKTSKYVVADTVPGLQMTEYRVRTYVDNYESRLQDLRNERQAYLASFDSLAEEVKTGF